MNKSIWLVSIVVGLLDSGLCSLKINCKSKMYETDEPDVHSCHIKQFTKQESYVFHVNYAQPSDIEEAHLGITARIMRTISSNDVDFIPSEIFTFFPNLCHFRMSTNLKELKPDDFAQAMNLTSMNLSNNKLKLIKSNVFSATARITRLLLLNSNEVQQTREGDTFPLHKLRELTLARNEIAEIEMNAFDGLKKLFDLDLSANQLTTIRRQSFAGLPSLDTLDLSNNKIEIIQDGAFDLPALRQLNLAHNKLTKLSDAVFERLPELQSINLNFNNIEFIGKSFNGLSNVAEISLDRNDIQDVDLTAFAKLPSLKMLVMTQSGFTFATTLIEGDQRWNSPLMKLNVGGNYLNNAAELNKLRIFPNLTFLGLSWNRFSNLDIGGNRTLKDFLPSLEMLDLYGNTMDSEHLLEIEKKLNALNVEVRR